MHTGSISQQTNESLSRHIIFFYPNCPYETQGGLDKIRMSLLRSLPFPANRTSESPTDVDRPQSEVTPRNRDVGVAPVPTRPATEATSESDTSTSPGRRGDPRMHRAVAARASRPHMTLIDALLHGGFVFPGLSEPGASDRTVRDLEGVLLYQRKNQLNRRLRLSKQKKDPKPSMGKEVVEASRGVIAGPNQGAGTDERIQLKQSMEQQPQIMESSDKQQRAMPTASAAAVLLLLSSSKTSAVVEHTAVP